MAKAKNPYEEDKKFYTKMKQNKTKQVAFNILFALSFLSTTAIIAGNISYQEGWVTAVLPVILCNIPVILAPLFQTWDY